MPKRVFSHRYPQRVTLTVTLLAMLLFVFGCDPRQLADGLSGDLKLGDTFHPEGFSAGNQHGQAFLSDTSACTACHGTTLRGGVAGQSCDECHSTWRDDCTFCHGGGDNDTGAPPLNLVGGDYGAAHSIHVEDTDKHAPFDCSACHVKPASILDEDHIDGDGLVEVAFSALNPDAVFEHEGQSCFSLYCHGDGSTVSGALGWRDEQPLACDSCHGFEDSAARLSGAHNGHLNNYGADCDDCHGDVIGSDDSFVDKSLHINGEPNVAPSGGTYDAQAHTCSNVSCHGDTRSW